MNRVIVTFFMLTMLASAASPLTGKWEGRMNDLPGVDLTVRETGGKVSGSIVFYFQQRGSDGKWHVAGKDTEPLLAPETDGKVLTFEVHHHRFHGSPELGPNVRFSMELTGADDAVLRNADRGAEPTPFKLARK